MRFVEAFAVVWAGLVLAVPVVRADAGFSKGPYLMDVQPSSVAVLFELEEPRAATVVARSAAGDEVRAESLAGGFHEVVLDGLAPRTAYDYSVTLDDGAEARGSFQTAPRPGEGPVEILVMGDNRTDATAHAAVVRAMAEHPADFVLNTGDMVAHGDSPEDWARMFDVQEPLLRSTPLFPALGNHELYQSGRGLERFLRYTRVPRELGGRETYYGFTYGLVRVLVVDSNQDWEEDDEQRSWLEEQLAAAEAAPEVRHVIVAMHHGPYSSGHHGGNEDMLASGLPELLRERGVSLVLSGHDHMYERGSVDGLHYIVTGGGGAPLYPVNARAPGQLAFEPVYHFLRVSVDGDRVTVTALRADGSRIERCGFAQGGPWECDGAPGDDLAAGPVHEGSDPTLFWLGRQLEKAGPWALASVVPVLFVGLWAVRRRRTR